MFGVCITCHPSRACRSAFCNTSWRSVMTTPVTGADVWQTGGASLGGLCEHVCATGQCRCKQHPVADAVLQMRCCVFWLLSASRWRHKPSLDACAPPLISVCARQGSQPSGCRLSPRRSVSFSLSYCAPQHLRKATSAVSMMLGPACNLNKQETEVLDRTHIPVSNVCRRMSPGK